MENKNYIVCFKNGQKIKISESVFKFLKDNNPDGSNDNEKVFWVDDYMIKQEEVLYIQPEENEIKTDSGNIFTYTIPTTTATRQPCCQCQGWCSHTGGHYVCDRHKMNVGTTTNPMPVSS